MNLARAVGRGDAPRFTASFGVVHSADADTFDELVSIADRALFSAKHAGRDRVASHEGGRTFEIHDATPPADRAGIRPLRRRRSSRRRRPARGSVTTSGRRTA